MKRMVVALGMAMATSLATAAPTIGGCPQLPANNIWNTRVDNLPVHAKSRYWVSSIGGTRNFHMDFGPGLYPFPPDPDAAPIGIPYVLVPGSQQKVTVSFTAYGDESDSSPGIPATESPPGSGNFSAQYPIPPNAPIEGVGNPANNGDRHVLVVDTSNCILYETGNSYPINGGASWEATGGAVFDLNSNALRPDTWTSADAAGLPILPGLARYEEAVAPGGIQHALRFTISTSQSAYIWPAKHQAGSTTNVNVPPMGARFRLKASKDISTLPAQAKAIAQAMKTYGIIVADNGSNWYVSGVPNDNWIDPQLKQLQNFIKGSDFEAVDVSSLMVAPTSGAVKQRPATVDLALSNQHANPGQTTTFTATVTGNDGTVSGTVNFKDGNTTIGSCGAVAIVSGQASCSTNALGAGVHTITAVYSGSLVYAPATSRAREQVVQTGATLLTPNLAALAFGGQSINTTSPILTVAVTNGSGSPVTVTAVSTPFPYGVDGHLCVGVTLQPGGSCAIDVNFTPTLQGTLDNLLTISYAGGGPTVIALTGTGERSLVTHYYRSILRRPPDASGKAYWEGEAARMQSIGANINEAWFSMAQFFYFSAEYLGFNRDNTGFVTDLYNTFFNRAPDSGGLAFWVGQIGQGMPREVVLASFMFSPEFATFAQNIFGDTAAPAETDTVMDFYRGLLARLPDQGGFDTWVQQFRTAQCGGAGPVYTATENISQSFANGTEYTSKNRSNAQYVGDLYNSFLRRGGDLQGVQFWINQLDAQTMTRNVVRQNFIASTEFQARVNNVVNQGCLP